MTGDIHTVKAPWSEIIASANFAKIYEVQHIFMSPSSFPVRYL